MSSVVVTYYSDVLCVWGYVAQIRVDELRRHFGDQVTIVPRFVPVFGDTPKKLGDGWRERGGYEAYAAHVASVVARFDHVTLGQDAWNRVRPASSHVPHAVVRALGLLVRDGMVDRATTSARAPCEELSWQLRLAFFRDGRDVGRVAVVMEVASEMGLPVDALRARLDDGSAWAALHADHEAVKEEGVRGSPTFVLNERRQILYGNVGYRILEANVLELLRDAREQATWC
jgi:predicted DsbA family dithiol-disulfide isomerase